MYAKGNNLATIFRSFLLPAFASGGGQWRWTKASLARQVLHIPYFRQLIYGQSPLNLRESAFVPRLSAALAVATTSSSLAAEEEEEANWRVVERELFFVVDALESARCLLDNHLIVSTPSGDSSSSLHKHSFHDDTRHHLL